MIRELTELDYKIQNFLVASLDEDQENSASICFSVALCIT